jgi:hypothetical protein
MARFCTTCHQRFSWDLVSQGIRNDPRTRGCVLFIGTQFSNLYTAVDTSARGRVGVCVVFVCKYVLGHSRVSQPLNLRLCLLLHFGFLTRPVCAGCNPHNPWNPRKLYRNWLPKHAPEDAEDPEDADDEDAEDAEDADGQGHNKHFCADHSMQT